jgi:hypothetical protein
MSRAAGDLAKLLSLYQFIACHVDTAAPSLQQREDSQYAGQSCHFLKGASSTVNTAHVFTQMREIPECALTHSVQHEVDCCALQHL